MTKMCLVHLVRSENGLEPTKRFLESYKKYPAGIPHKLLIIFKGFRKGEQREYLELLQPFSSDSMNVMDFGFDIRPYFMTVKRFDFQYFVFLNSFSTVLCKDWMAKMYECVKFPSVGAVSATGSWESIYANILNQTPDNALRLKLIRLIRQNMWRHQFPEFPNYHLRTNAFMASRELLLNIRVPLMFRKKDAHRFESGVHSFTRQIINMNKNVLVVGRDGVGYEKEAWALSDTFRQGNQGNLLIADNQTNAFSVANIEVRQKLSKAAWGNVMAEMPV